MTQISKSQLRQQLLQLRKTLTPDQVHQKSQKICNQIADLDVFQKAQHILTYYPYNNEVDLLLLIDQHPKKTWYLPKLKEGNEFIALPFQFIDELQKNKYGISEPIQISNERYEDQIDLILIPGVGFDEKGNRLGMGKGYYDRYLKSMQHAFKIGVCFLEQRVDQVPTDSYDVSVDMVVSD